GKIVILLGNGDGSFTPAAASPGFLANFLAAADLNGDGVLDLILAINERSGCGAFNCLEGSGTVLMVNDDPTCTAVPALNLSNMTVGLLVGDFNGDGKVDVITGGGSMIGGGEFTRALTFLLGNGDGSFQASSQNFAVSYALSAGDFDGDGKLD